MFISVLLPAPFSPRMPRISPVPTSTVTSSLASTPGKRLVMCSSWSAFGVIVEAFTSAFGGAMGQIQAFGVRLDSQEPAERRKANAERGRYWVGNEGTVIWPEMIRARALATAAFTLAGTTFARA